MSKKKTNEMKISLDLIKVIHKEELDWLHSFISEYHSIPQFMLPTREELKRATFRFFKAMGTEAKGARPKLIGITGYEIRTPYLAETQKTIIAPEFRGAGWGRALSHAIEEEVAQAGFYKIRSCIYVNNIAMITIKLAQGYYIEGFHPDHDGPGLHEYSLGKVLKRPNGEAIRKAHPMPRNNPK